MTKEASSVGPDPEHYHLQPDWRDVDPYDPGPEPPPSEEEMR